MEGIFCMNREETFDILKCFSRLTQQQQQQLYLKAKELLLTLELEANSATIKQKEKLPSNNRNHWLFPFAFSILVVSKQAHTHTSFFHDISNFYATLTWKFLSFQWAPLMLLLWGKNFEYIASKRHLLEYSYSWAIVGTFTFMIFNVSNFYGMNNSLFSLTRL